jgi:hypothetical protein
MESKRRLGVPFKNTFAALEPGNPEVVSLAYDESFFNLHVLPVDDKPVQAEGERVYLQKSSHLFLENLAGGCQTKFNILRGFGRNLRTSPRDGAHSQTALGVHGPPATMKSTWPNVLKLLVDPRFVQEQVKQMTPFSAGQLESCQLRILSDLQSIPKDMVGLLKGLIGREICL